MYKLRNLKNRGTKKKVWAKKSFYNKKGSNDHLKENINKKWEINYL